MSDPAFEQLLARAQQLTDASDSLTALLNQAAAAGLTAPELETLFKAAAAAAGVSLGAVRDLWKTVLGPGAREQAGAALFKRGDHVEIAKRLAEGVLQKANAVFTDARFYEYVAKTGAYSEMAEAALSVAVQSFAGAPLANGKPLLLNAHDVRGSMKLASDLVAHPGFFAEAPAGVAFANGFLTVEAHGVDLRSHSSSNRARYAYPFDFVAGALPENFLRLLRDAFKNDQDASAKIELIREYIGVSMIGRATMFQRALVLTGDGSNGKGVVAKVTEAAMPPGSVCAIAPQDAGQEYRRAMLAGKLLNIVSELPETDILDSENWKALIAGDTTTGREIRKEPFTFRPVAGHIYSANRLPGTSDQTHGFWRRLIVIRFNRIFSEKEQNPNLAEEIIASDASAIVSWALEGAQRALARGRFETPKTSDEAVAAWKSSSDQVRAFIEELYRPLKNDQAPATGTKANVLYARYRHWAEENGHRPVASNKFGERMRLIGLPVHRGAQGERHYPVVAKTPGDEGDAGDASSKTYTHTRARMSSFWGSSPASPESPDEDAAAWEGTIS